jgi:predicted PurR-regulated permease PerM
MYFSYALTVGLFIVIGAIYFAVYQDPPLVAMVITSFLFAVILSPFVFRLSRLLMIYLAAPYRRFDPEYGKSKKNG